MDLEALAKRYADTDAEAEEKLLREIFAQGWEAGCWLRIPDEQMLLNTRAEVDKLLDSTKARKKLLLDYGDDPHPGGLDFSPVQGEEACFVIVGQRCDVIAQFKTEPLVELAPARRTTDKNLIATSWKNSPREFPLDPGATDTFLVDVRTRYWLPKIDLLSYEPRQGLPPNAPPNRPRYRFGLRLAQRYNRTALPDRLVEAVLRPLDAVIKGDADADELFSEWMIYHGEQWNHPPHLIGLYVIPDLEGAEAERAEQSEQQALRAEKKFDDLVKALVAASPEAEELMNLDDAPTGAVNDEALPYALWRASWKLDLDAHTFGGDSDGAVPDR
jgi:hypothetical protein